MFNFGYSENFKFSLNTDLNLPNRPNASWRDKQLNDSNGACNKAQTSVNGYYAGFSCGAIIQYDGWEIKDDYPW